MGCNTEGSSVSFAGAGEPFLPGVFVEIHVGMKPSDAKAKIVETLYKSGRHSLADRFRTDTLNMPLLRAAARYVNIVQTNEGES